MRIAVWALTLLVAGCAAPSGAYFEKAGQVIKACEPAPGWSIAVTEAEDACIKAYQQKGWVRLAGPPPDRPAN
jgi:hypothetical protein